jgi:hypothetical protein
VVSTVSPCRERALFLPKLFCWNCSCRGHTSWLHNGSILRVYSTGSLYGFSLRVLSTGSLFGLFFGLFIGTTVLIILSIYMGPVDPQVDHHQAIQSILCCAYITTLPVIFIIFVVSALEVNLLSGDLVRQEDVSPAPMPKKSICVFCLEFMLGMCAI